MDGTVGATSGALGRRRASIKISRATMISTTSPIAPSTIGSRKAVLSVDAGATLLLPALAVATAVGLGTAVAVGVGVGVTVAAGDGTAGAFTTRVGIASLFEASSGCAVALIA